jgi:hypothetical protein
MFYKPYGLSDFESLCYAPTDKIVVFLLAVIAKYLKRVRHVIVCWQGRRVPLHSDQVAIIRVAISFLLWTLPGGGETAVGKAS